MVIRGKLVGDDHASDIDVRDGRVHAIKRAGHTNAPKGASNTHILPLIFDIQVNGYAGIDLQNPALRPEDLAQLDHALARVGVGAWIPTLITNAQSQLEQGCRVIADALSDPALAKRIPGVHLEGPYISPVDGPRGAHAKPHARNPNIREFDRCLAAADGKVVYTTIAPELPGAIPFIRHAVKQGVVVSLGHHAANADQIARAADAGATMVTHLGNGIASTIDRHHNPIWPQLADDRLACSLIPDLHHVPAPMLRAVVSAKGKRRIMITSDAVHIAGLKPGLYDLAGTPVTLGRDGVVRLSGTRFLAGSATPLIQGVFNLAHAADLNLADAVRSATAIPARILGVRQKPQPIRKGALANFVVCQLSARGTVKVSAVFRDGEPVRGLG